MILTSNTKIEILRGIPEAFKNTYDCLTLYSSREIELDFNNHSVYINGTVLDSQFSFESILIVNELDDLQLKIDAVEQESEFLNEVGEMLDKCVQDLKREF